jgi:peptidoglycan-N-acetylglucosamine deacetylase
MWPDGTRSAACLTFDLDGDEVWRAEVPGGDSRPGLLSQGVYGLGWGLKLVLDRLRERRLRATFFVPGRIAERFPQKVELLLEDGHEVAHHGYTHRPPAVMTRNEELEELVRGQAALRACGVSPRGYRAPAWDVSADTDALVAEFGFSYTSNLMSSVFPFRSQAGVVELPVHWVLDDAAHYWFSQVSFSRKLSAPAEVLDMWLGEADGIHQLGGLAVHTFHPQVIGRPGRLPVLERILEHVSADDVWTATAEEIADWVADREAQWPSVLNP